MTTGWHPDNSELCHLWTLVQRVRTHSSHPSVALAVWRMEGAEGQANGADARRRLGLEVPFEVPHDPLIEPRGDERVRHHVGEVAQGEKFVRLAGAE